MKTLQEKKIKQLIDKYNDILLISMRLAISEDFINLMLLNREDSNFELKDLLTDKTAFSNLILKEFLKKNSSSVIDDLKNMSDSVPDWKQKLNDKRK